MLVVRGHTSCGRPESRATRSDFRESFDPEDADAPHDCLVCFRRRVHGCGCADRSRRRMTPPQTSRRAEAGRLYPHKTRGAKTAPRSSRAPLESPGDRGAPPSAVPAAGPGSGFACSWSADGPYSARVCVAGELDLATTPLLECALHEAQSHARLVVLDLRELTFMDSSGVHLIVAVSIRARQRRRRLVILRGPPGVDRTFMLTGSCGDVEIIDAETWRAAAPRAGA